MLTMLGLRKNVSFKDPKDIFEKEKGLANEPFLFQGNNGKAVVLVHGWTSTPYELRRLGIFLNENGYTVNGVLLKGHGTKPEDMEKIKWQEWVDDVRDAYFGLKKNHKKVYVAGTSIGATLSMLIASEVKDISGIVLMATPFKLRFEAFGKFLARVFLVLKKNYYKKYYPPTFGSSGLVTRLVSYQKYPVRSTLEVVDAVREARRNISKISQPCLIMQSTHDHIVISDSMDNIYKRINSHIKKKKYIEKSYHTFIADIKNEHVFEDILNFLNEN